MPNKIKIFFSFLAFITLFSVYSVFNSLGGKPASFAIIGVNSTPLPKLEEDIDRDGLTNNEESYWNTDFENPDTDGDGFLDGEEIVSGFDPLTAGPNDQYIDTGTVDLSRGIRPINLTQKFSTLIASGLFVGDLKNTADDETYSKSIYDLSLAAIYDSDSALTPENVELSDLKITTNTKKVQQEYVNNLFNIIEKKLLAEIRENESKYM